MENIINKDKSITHKSNILNILLNLKKHAQQKYNHYSPIPQECMNTCSRREQFRYFRILLDSGRSQTINMVKLISTLKQKIYRNNNVGNPSREVQYRNEGENILLPDII